MTTILNLVPWVVGIGALVAFVGWVIWVEMTNPDCAKSEGERRDERLAERREL